MYPQGNPCSRVRVLEGKGKGKGQWALKTLGCCHYLLSRFDRLLSEGIEVCIV